MSGQKNAQNRLNTGEYYTKLSRFYCFSAERMHYHNVVEFKRGYQWTDCLNNGRLGHDYKNLSIRFACTCVIQHGVFVIKWNYESYLSQNNSLSISNSIPVKNKHSW